MLRWAHSVEDGKRPGFYSRRTRGYHVTLDGEQRADNCHPTHWRELTDDERTVFRVPMCDRCARRQREPASELCELCESQEAKIKWE